MTRTVEVAAGDVGGQVLAAGLHRRGAHGRRYPSCYGSGKRYFGSVPRPAPVQRTRTWSVRATGCCACAIGYLVDRSERVGIEGGVGTTILGRLRHLRCQRRFRGEAVRDGEASQ